MREKDRLGVTVIFEAGVAVASAAVGNPAMGLAAGLLPIADFYMQRSQKRLNQVQDLVAETVDQVGATAEEFVGWMTDDPRHLALFHHAAEGAYETFDEQKVKAFGRALIDGYQDPARIDLDTLVVKALRDLDPVHVVALDYYDENRDVDVQASSALHRRLEPALGPITSTLERHGCVHLRQPQWPGPSRGFAGAQPKAEWVATEFGRQCLRYIKGEAEPPPITLQIW